jgi:hypothetical protein
VPPDDQERRRLPVSIRAFQHETIGSYLTRLAYANSL